MVTLQEYIDGFTEKYGEDKKKWAVVCPICGCVQTVQDFMNTGMKPEKCMEFWGFSCIGRYNSKLGCDYTLGGLITVGHQKIKTDDGRIAKRFFMA